MMMTIPLRRALALEDDNREQERPPPSLVVENDNSVDDLSGTLHDPWLHFAIFLSVLLYDVNHKGLPNNELLAERDPLSDRYGREECMSSFAVGKSASNKEAIRLKELRRRVNYKRARIKRSLISME